MAPVHFSFQICRADGGSAAGLVDGLSEYGYKATKELLKLYGRDQNFYGLFCRRLPAPVSRKWPVTGVYQKHTFDRVCVLFLCSICTLSVLNLYSICTQSVLYLYSICTLSVLKYYSNHTDMPDKI